MGIRPREQPAEGEGGRYHWLVLTVTSLGGFLVVVNMGSLNVALPVISKHFHADAFTSGWFLLSYMLVNTILILVFGQISDIFGRKKLYLGGMALFTLASLAIGFSPNSGALIALRVVQAAGGAVVITNTTALIADAFPLSRLGTGLGINILIASSAQLVGPVVGGVIAAGWGWRWVFWFNVPIGIVAVVWGLTVLRPSPAREIRDKVDLTGGLLFFLTLGGLVVALSEAGDLGWGSPLVAGGLLLFAAGAPVFLWRERCAASPMLDLGMLRSRSFSMAQAATFLNSFARSAVVLLFALYFQFADKVSAYEAGFRVLPVVIGMLVVSPVAGMLTRVFSVRLLASLGLGLTMAGLGLLMAVVGSDMPYAATACAMLLLGVGSGMFQTSNTTAIMTLVPKERRGAANGLRSMLNNMGQVLSTAVALMIVGIGLPARLKDMLYAGADAVLGGHDLALIVRGYRWALLALLAATLLGLVASLSRSPDDPAARREAAPAPPPVKSPRPASSNNGTADNWSPRTTRRTDR